ncbi:MAG: hypothetical protein KKC19_03010 [Nanoarchaeota archaeon]|nr:hypothetical protein [Nanoarchaeota archaeon]
MKRGLVIVSFILVMFIVTSVSAYSVGELSEDVKNFFSSFGERFTGHSTSSDSIKTIGVSEFETASLSCDEGQVIRSAEALYWCPDGSGRSVICNTDSAIGKSSFSFTFRNVNCGGDPCIYVAKKGDLTITCGDFVCSDYNYETSCIADGKCEWEGVLPYEGVCLEKVPEEESYTCIDSDGGIDSYVSGATKSNYPDPYYAEYSDYCANDFWLNEGYCLDDGRVWSTGYLCPNGCLDGACVSTIEEVDEVAVGCTDSDGDNPLKKGNLTIGGFVHSDYCITDQVLAELVCESDDFYSEKGYPCPNGCLDGACVSTIEEVDEVAVGCTDSDGGVDYYVKGIGQGAYEGLTDDNYIFSSEGEFLPTENSFSTDYDHCVGEDSIYEVYCTSDGNLSATGFFCPNGCLDGACIKKEVNALPQISSFKTLSFEGLYRPDEVWTSCLETDEGINSRYALEVWRWKFQRAKNLKNECVDDNTLREYSCSDKNPSYVEYKCGEGCLDGKCVGDTGETDSFLKIVQKDGNYSLEDSYFDIKSGSVNIIVQPEYSFENVEIVFWNESDGSGPRFFLNPDDTSPGTYGGVLDLISESISGYYYFVIFDSRYNNVNAPDNLELAGMSLRPISGNTFEPVDEDIGSSCESIWYTGDSNDNLDLVFVGDKYEDLDKFQRDMESYSRDLLSEPTWEAYKNRINLWRVDELSSLGCKHTTECAEGILKPLTEDIFEFPTAMCCDADKAKDLAVGQCPNDHTVVVENSPIRGGTVYPSIDNFFFTNELSPFTYLRIGLIGETNKHAGVSTSTSSAGGRMILHELGHLIGLLPDYYRDDPQCVNHECMMCDSGDDLGNEGLCLDRARMVEQFNQFCNAKVSIFTKNPTSPYPNPFDPSEGQTQKISYKLDYPREADPCYILMHVYNRLGQEVRVLVSDEPQLEGEYIFEWDGKDNLGFDSASGVYYYIITGGSDSKTVKGTLIK